MLGLGLALVCGLIAFDAMAQTVVRGKFDQTRHLKGHASPLAARGVFTFSADDGLIWHVTHPVEVMTVMSPRGLMQSIGDAPPTYLPANQLPMFVTFRAIIAAALTGNFTTLADIFTVERTEGEGGFFTVVLTPRGEGDARTLSLRRLELSGRDLIETAILHKLNGDIDRIAFLDQSRDSGGLNDAEKKLIALLVR
jgi:hypothetical protein